MMMEMSMALTTRNLAFGTALLAMTAGAAFAGEAQRQPTPTVMERAPLTQSTALIDSYPATDKTPGVVATVGRGDAAPTVIAAGMIASDAGAAKRIAAAICRVVMKRAGRSEASIPLWRAGGPPYCSGT